MGTRHIHVMEIKSGWPDKTWVLGHRPDGEEMIMVRDGSPAPLHRDEDWGFVGNVLTMTHQPTDGVKHFLYYSHSGIFSTAPISDPLVTVTSPQYLYPRENGATAQWQTGSPADIDDTQPISSHDGDTTYMENTAANGGDDRVHLFKKRPFLPIPAGQTITNVILRAAGRRVSGASSTARTRLRISGTTTTNSTLFTMISPGTTYQTGSVTFTTNPVTGNAWTPEEVEEMEIGAIIDADGAGVHRITALFLEVNYA